MTDTNYWHDASASRVKRRRFLQAAGIGGAGLLGAALVGCGDDDTEGTPAPTAAPNGDATPSSVGDGEPVHGGSLTVEGREPPNWDPHLQAPAAATGIAMSFIYPSLVRYDLDHEDYAFGSTIVTGYLAESWERPDPTTYVFHLKPGVTWDEREPTGGREIVADDVAYSFERFYTSEFMEGVTPQPAPDIEVQDDHTLTFRIEEPNSQLLTFYGNQNFVIVPREVEEEFGDFRLAENARGAGPWIIDDYQPGSRITFSRNPNFIDDPRPYLDELTMLYDLDQEALFAAYRGDQLDVLGTIQPAQLDQMENSVPDATYEQRPGCCARSVGTRLDVGPTDDLRVRQGISKALNREAWLESIYRGVGMLPWSVYTDLWQEFTLPDESVSDEARYNFAYDVDEARSLLEAAGTYQDGSVDLHVFPSSDPSYEQEGTLIIDFMQQIGVNLEMVTADYGAYIATTYRGDYDGLAWFPVGEFSPAGMLNRYTPGGGGRNVNHVDDDELNQLMSDFYAAEDREESIDICHQIQLRSAEQLFFVMGPHGHTFHTWRPWVGGYEGRTDTAYGEGYQWARVWRGDDA